MSDGGGEREVYFVLNANESSTFFVSMLIMYSCGDPDDLM